MSILSEQIDSVNYKMQYSLISFVDSSHFKLETKNKTLVLDFWFANCPPCRALMPHYKSLSENYNKDSSIIFLSINSGSIDSFVKANKLLNTLKMDKNTFYYDQDGHLTKLMNINNYPELIIINKYGKIAFRRRGFNSDETFVFSSKMQEIIDKIKQE